MPKRRRKNIEVRVNKTAVRVEKAAADESPEDAEKEKLMLMKVGVVCIMIILAVAWIFNLKYQFKINSNNKSDSGFNWAQTKAELDKAMGQVKASIAEIKKLQQDAAPAEQPELTPEQIDLLKGKLINQAFTTIATSTK